MSSQIKNCCCLIIALFILGLCNGQKQFHILIQFVPKLDSSNIVASIDDGKGLGDFPVKIKDGNIEINCKVYSKWATLNLVSPVTSNQKTYFITNEVSKIIYSIDNKTAKDYPFVNGKLTNAIELTNCPEIKRLMDYTLKERKDLHDFQEKHKAELKTNDSLMSIYKQKDKIFEKKSLEFIKLNNNQYFYLWYFNLAYKNSEYIKADSLLQYFKEAFYPKYKDLFEAKLIVDYIMTPPSKRYNTSTDFYALAQLLKLNQIAPDFTTTDISGRKFSLSQLKGKYVLLNFWATWCGPCVKELPLFKKLRDDFSESQLEIISISEDNTKEALEKGIKKYSLNWTHVYRDMGLINKYQISSAIPLTFLIDKEGKLVFMQVGSLSNTDELRKLLISK